MATERTTFAKFNFKLNTNITEIEFGGQTIEVKQYLPIQEKMKLINRVLNDALGDNTTNNALALDMFANLEILFAYTNIQFTDKQKEDLAKLYDLMECNGLFAVVFDAIPATEYNDMRNNIYIAAKNIIAHRTSALGILEAISTDYSNLNLDATAIQQKLADPENLTLVKDILTKMG